MTVLVALLVSAVAAPLPSLDEFFQTFSQKREGLQALRADFTQTNTTSGESDTVQGSIFYVNPRRIIFRYPEAELTYLFDDTRVYEYDAGLRQVQISDLGNDPQAEALFLGFGENADRLKKAYDIELFRPDRAECGAIGMILRPRNREEGSGVFQEVRLFLDEENYLPCAVRIVNDEDSQVYYTLPKYTLNPPFQPADTQIRVAEGTEVIQNDQLLETAGPDGLLLPDQPITPKAPEAS